MCDHFSVIAKGGRGKKSNKGRGRPKGVTPKALVSAIKETAPKPIFTHASNPQYLGTIHPSLVCVMCMDVLQSPVELPCNQYICASCCINSVRVSASTQCPCCYDCNLAENMPRKPPHVVCELLAGLLLECSECHTSVQANSYQAHFVVRKPVGLSL